jgi:hypothetical protein
MARYVLLADDERFGLAKGDVLECVPYRYEPDCKLTVVERVSDHFDPSCNVYRHQVAADESLVALTCSCCQPTGECWCEAARAWPLDDDGREGATGD